MFVFEIIFEFYNKKKKLLQAGRTALHYAAADPNGEHMIKVLQKSGGDAFIEDKVCFLFICKKKCINNKYFYSMGIHHFIIVHMEKD